MTATTVQYVYWQDEDAWLGYLEEFPDYPTQGETLADLEDHLRDLYADLTGGKVRGVRRVAAPRHNGQGLACPVDHPLARRGSALGIRKRGVTWCRDPAESG